MSIDVQTVYLFSFLLFLLTPLLVLYVLKDVKNHGVVCWCVAGLLIGLGIVLVGFRGALPSWISFHLAQLLIIAGLSLRVVCLSQPSLVTRTKRLTFYLVLTPVFLLCFDLAIRTGSESLRLLVVLVFHAIPIADLLWVCRGLARDTLLAGYRLIALASGLILLAIALRALFIVATEVESVFSFGADQLVLIVANASAVILMNIGFVQKVIVIEEQAKQKALVSKNQSNSNLLDLLKEGPGYTARVISGVTIHELSQPLAALLATAQTLQSADINSMAEKDRRKFVDSIALLAQKSSDIVGTLRELFSSLTIERKLVNVRRIVRAVVRLFRENGLNVEYHFDDTQMKWPPVLGNPIALGQALHNLIRNAVEASSDESRVLVAVTLSNNFFVISVVDTGKGMSKETLEVLFEPFSSTKGSGMGLGLWLTQAIIELHDGEIEVMSKEGEGTEVLVRLPVSVGVEVGLA